MKEVVKDINCMIINNKSFTEADLTPLIEQLKDKASAKRRAAAKKLRKIANPFACSALLEALEEEIKDVRTWETQYQMIMALGECGNVKALPLIKELANRPYFEATTLYTGLGDAFMRLGRQSENDPSPLYKTFTIKNNSDYGLIEGALRAIAMLKLVFSPEVAKNIINHVIEFDRFKKPHSYGLAFWTIAACAGWKGESVKGFLEKHVDNPKEEIRKLAISSLQGKYTRFNIL